MDISDNQLESVRQIGFHQDSPMYEYVTKGGLHLIVSRSKTGQKRTLGSGSMSDLARFIAERDNQGVRITELSKSEGISPALFLQNLPAAFELTQRLRALDNKI